MVARRLIVVTDQATSPAFAPIFSEVLDDPEKILETDVLLFEGGTDVNPKYYGQSKNHRTQPSNKERDHREILFFRKAQQVGAACIGVCRGAQLLTVLSGGKLIQDVTGHGMSHNINTSDGTILRVSSTHHQMCYPFDMPKEDYSMIGWAAPKESFHYYFEEDRDTVEPPVEPEIIWFPKTRSLAIQGHPEYLALSHPFPVYCRNLVQKLIFKEINV